MASSHVWISPIKTQLYATVSPHAIHTGYMKRPSRRRRRGIPSNPLCYRMMEPTRNQSYPKQNQMAVVDGRYSGTPSLCSGGRRLLAQSTMFPGQCSAWLVRCIAYAGTVSHGTVLRGSYRWFGVSPEFDRGLKAGESCQLSVAFPWWLISSSVVPTVLSSRLSPGLGPAPSC